MTNDEGSSNAQMTKRCAASLFRHSDFRHWFVIRRSSFVIFPRCSIGLGRD